MSVWSRLGKHLEGWQVGVLVVLIVATTAAVLVPRSAVPEAVPLPRASSGEIRAARRANEQAAIAFATGGASEPVERIGATLRAIGRAEWDGDEAALARGMAELARGIARATAENDVDGLVLLRTYQAELFARAYCDYLRTGSVADDLIELGGAAVREFSDNGWLTPGSRVPAHVDLLLSALYKRRFERLVAKGHPALAPHPVEERLLLGYLLEHPPPDRLLSEGAGTSATRFMLSRIDEISALDPSYPAAYARGVVLFKTKDYELAALSFDDFLHSSADGPYRLRAVNYLKASLERCEGEP
ncbi:MAG: hypothetical protein IPM79_17170 [Polyangiaceae bacterium]|nr:hypothetical protein [Polyangiaceae bacterium]